MKARLLGAMLLVGAVGSAGAAAAPAPDGHEPDAPASSPSPSPSQSPSPSPSPSPSLNPSPSALAPQVADPDSDCTREGTEGDDVLEGTGGPDVICGLGGNDVLHGLGGDDELRGGDGNDVLIGGPGNDRLDGGAGSDTVTYAGSGFRVVVDVAVGVASGEGRDRLIEIDRVIGSGKDDVLSGTSRRDILLGGPGTDLLFGRGGNDLLEGGPGIDYLAGGAGADTLRGGPGSDICRQPPGRGAQSGCSPPHPRDPRDVRGPLDVRRVRAALGRPRPVWKIHTGPRWSTRRIWDRGYAVVLLDTRGDARVDYYVIARSTKKRVTAKLFRARPRGRDRMMRGGVRAWRTNQRSISVRVGLGRLRIGPDRAYYRWGVETLFTGRRCRRVCMDFVPGPVSGYAQPLPR